MIFFFNDTAATEIYTLSLHDALPISCSIRCAEPARSWPKCSRRSTVPKHVTSASSAARSEEHTSELQSLTNLVCRLLLEKKKKQRHNNGERIKAPNTLYSRRDNSRHI